MAYRVNTGPNFSGITIADDRFAAFETIRDANDPLMQDRRSPSKPLANEDYFGTLPEESAPVLHQMRLHALVEHAQRKQAEEKKAEEESRKEAAKLCF